MGACVLYICKNIILTFPRSAKGTVQLYVVCALCTVLLSGNDAFMSIEVTLPLRSLLLYTVLYYIYLI